VSDADATHVRFTGIGADRLELPPGYTAISLREKGDAFAHAIDIAPLEGAGTLVWVRRFDTVEFALVLEPEQPLGEARRALYAVMNACADAIGVYCPPERPLAFAWPDTISLDGGVLGGVRLAWPPDCPEDATPDWLVAGVMLRSVVAQKRNIEDVIAQEVAVLSTQFDHIQRRGTSLEAEGFEMMDAGQLISSFCRYFLVQLDEWHESGFVPIGQAYLARLPEQPGVKRGISPTGDLLMKTAADLKATATMPLLEALAVPQWRDPETAEPWL
jgi:biotin-(acetyl-CoA carboxylase) ligase